MMRHPSPRPPLLTSRRHPPLHPPSPTPHPSPQSLSSLESFECVTQSGSQRQRGFCFAEFSSHEAAHRALRILGSSPCPVPSLLDREEDLSRCVLKVDW